jgi:hypothetical protein
MVEKLRRRFAFDAHDAAVRMVRVGIEADDAAVFDGRDRRAMRRAQSAIAANGVRGFGRLTHASKILQRLWRIQNDELECWSDGVLDYGVFLLFPNTPTLH